VFQVPFDARDWFLRASKDQIVELAAINWTGDRAADKVADFPRLLDPTVDRVVAYRRLVNHDKNGNDMVGFEVFVETIAALEWLKQERPDVSALLPDDVDL
jgi:hypothetical protein